MQFTAADQAFRAEVRNFIRANLPTDIRDRVLNGMEITMHDTLRWHRILYEKGWVAPVWPKEHGGAGWNAVRKYIFDDELGLAGAPRIPPHAIGMLGPLLMAFGTEAQKREHLPRILSGEEIWCQG